jgi:non-specific serine/threonine protein kinase
MPGHEPGSISLSSLPPGGLVGRAAEFSAIQRTLGRSRLVTITGPPGVGKTAVGIAAAAAAGPSFADGAWLVPLDSLHHGDLLLDTIADVLKVPGRRTGNRLETLLDELRDRCLLIVLDTCEHVLGACTELARKLLLLPCRDVRILATSREPLRAPGGLTVAVGPLPLRHAVTVFGRRAAEAAPGFQITPDNRATVEAICWRLDRLPLAIELAARRMASGSLAELHSQLEEGYWFLQNPAAAPARHKTLCAAIGWSYRLCTPAEQLLWARLSVFTGSFQVRDAQDVCADGDLAEQQIDALVDMLAARSVLRVDLHTGRHTRFRMPATIRAYGAAMLSPDDHEWERRHQAWQAGHQSRQRDTSGRG